MELPSISVIIPAYNAQKTIASTIRSIKSLNSPPLECIVVDDGSTDQTCDIVQKEGAILVSAKENQGPGLARNIGAQEAKGEFLAFTDADCVVKADWLEKLYLKFEENDCCGVTGPYAGPVQGHVLGTIIDRWIRYNQRKVPQKIYSCISSNLFVKKKDFDEIGGFPFYKLPGSNRFYYGNEDEEFANLLAVKKKKPFIWLSSSSVYHDYRDNFKSHFNQQKLWVEAILVSIARFPTLSSGEESNYSSLSSIFSIASFWLTVGSLSAVYFGAWLSLASLPFFIYHLGHIQAIALPEKKIGQKFYFTLYTYFFIAFTSLAWTKGLLTGGFKFIRCYYHWRIKSHA